MSADVLKETAGLSFSLLQSSVSLQYSNINYCAFRFLHIVLHKHSLRQKHAHKQAMVGKTLGKNGNVTVLYYSKLEIWWSSSCSAPDL